MSVLDKIGVFLSLPYFSILKNVQRGATVDTLFCPKFFQIYFSQNRFYFRAKDFSFLWDSRTKISKKKRESQSRVKFKKLIFSCSVSLVEFIVKIGIGYSKLKMMWIKLLKIYIILGLNFEKKMMIFDSQNTNLTQ